MTLEVGASVIKNPKMPNERMRYLLQASTARIRSMIKNKNDEMVRPWKKVTATG